MTRNVHAQCNLLLLFVSHNNNISPIATKLCIILYMYMHVVGYIPEGCGLGDHRVRVAINIINVMAIAAAQMGCTHIHTSCN